MREALRSLRYGTIELVLHDGRVAQPSDVIKFASGNDLVAASPPARPIGPTGPPEVHHSNAEGDPRNACGPAMGHQYRVDHGKCGCCATGPGTKLGCNRQQHQ
ncbi:MAG: YezD family protein [Gemmatimonadales bacterium]|nr:YezD family protein [Gemmatimonadales bacterium]